MKSHDIVGSPEFKVNLSDYLAKQIAAIDAKIQSRGVRSTVQPSTGLCSSDSVTVASLPDIYGPRLSQDNVVRSSLATVSSTALQRGPAIAPLTYADFVNFSRAITDASLLDQPTLDFAGVAPAQPARETLLSTSVPATPGSGSPVLSYIGA